MEDDLETQESAEVKSMDDTLAETFAKIQGEITQDDTETESPKLSTRKRDESGKFARNDDAVDVIDVPQATNEAEPATVVEDRPPSSLRKEVQEKWATLDPAIKEEFRKREDDFHKGIESYKGRAQEAEYWEQMVSPYVDAINKSGIPPQNLIGSLLEAQKVLSFGDPLSKANLIHQIAQQYGVDLGSVNQIQQNPQMLVMNKLQALEQSIAQREQQDARNAQLQEQHEQEKLNSDVQAWAVGKEHLETLRNHMAALLREGEASSLDDAYEKAMWANPTTRAVEIAKQQQQAKAEANRKAQEAKKAGNVNLKHKGVLPAGNGGGGTIEETLRDNMHKMGLFS